MSPLELSDLPVATSAADNDVTLLRKGLTDYQCAVRLIRQINIAALNSLPGGAAVATDLLIISRNISGNPSNFQIQFSQVGFVKGTRMWFYQPDKPIGWSIVPNTGDKLIACQDTSTNYNGVASAGSQGGQWLQKDVDGVDGKGLNLNQIPNHYHGVGASLGSLDFGQSANARYGNTNTASFLSKGITGATTSPTANPTWNEGSCGPHNHGDSWRPLANVGIVCNKDS